MARQQTVIILISANTEWQAVRSLFPDAAVESSPLGEWFVARLPTLRPTPAGWETGATARPGVGTVADATPPAPAGWETGATPRPHAARDSGATPRPSVLFFHGGWGKIAAAASTQYVIDRWQPGLLINLGTCGGFAGAIERGTIVLAERTLVYDIIEQMGDAEAAIAHYTTTLDLSWLGESEGGLAVETAPMGARPPEQNPPARVGTKTGSEGEGRLHYPAPVQRALLISADRDLVAAELPQLQARFGAIAGDWESGAIAYVAARNGVRCLILRGVTDLVGESGGEAYDGTMELFRERTRDVMRRLVEMLPGWVGRLS